MGTFSGWSYTAKATFWDPTMDEYDQPVSYVRSVLSCSFKAGGNLAVDSVGEQFTPKTTIYLEAEDADTPKVGWRVAIGDIAGASPPSDAEIIRMAMKHDASLFAEGTPDRVLMT
jgi:hypothetical protein